MPYKDPQKQKEFQQAHYQNNKEKFSDRRKRNRRANRDYATSLKTKCSICGYCRCPEALDFHHLDNKTDRISFMMKQVGLETLKKEITKCVVVCSNCHREIHAGLISPPG